MPAKPAQNERILVVGNGFLGDTVLGIPFLRNLRRRFPRAVIDVLIAPAAAPVLANCPYVDEVMAWPRPSRWQRLLPRAVAGLYGHAAWLRSRGYSRAYLFKRSFSSALLVRLAGIPLRVGHVAEGRGWLLSRAVDVHRGRHQAEAYLDLLRGEGIDVDDGHNENWVCERDRGLLDSMLTDVPSGRTRVFLALRSTNREKHWPTDRWAALIEWLVTLRGCDVFLCGGPRDAEMHARVVGLLAPNVAGHVHDHSALVPLRQVGGLLVRMDLCVGVDSGLPHIAASHGVPVVTLFGPTDPRQWHPWKTASEVVCDSRAAAQGRGSMQAIGVEQVAAAVDRLLVSQVDRRPAPRSEPVTALHFCDAGVA